MELQLLCDEGTHLLHARAIDAQIAVAGAGGGAEVDGLGSSSNRNSTSSTKRSNRLVTS